MYAPKGDTKSVLIIRGTYHQEMFMYYMYRRGQSEKYLKVLPRSTY